MSRRDLLVVAHSHFPNDPRIRKQVNAAAAAGFSVDVICLRDEGEESREVTDGVRIRRLPIRRDRRRGLVGYALEYLGFALAACAWISLLFLRHRHRNVHVHNMPDALVFAAFLPRLAGARLILDIHDFMPELYRSRYGIGSGHPAVRLLHLLERVSCAFAHAVVVTHERGRERLLRRGVPAEKLTVIMNTAPMRGGSGSPPREPKSEPPFTAIYHGLLSDVYDLETAVRAVARLGAAGETIRLLLVGSGPRARALEALARELDAADLVRFTGFVPPARIHSLLATADAGLAVLRNEAHQQVALPTKMFEAIAAGLPVITTPTLVITDIFSSKDVVFVPTGDVEALAQALLALRDDPTRREQLGRNAWRTLWPLRWEIMERRYIELLVPRAGREPTSGEEPRPSVERSGRRVWR